MRERIRSLTESAGASPARRVGPGASRRRTGTPSNAIRRSAANGPGGDTFEWDMRKSDGPTDRAFYDCSCGYQFTARVATTVSCPNCGAGQAW